METKVCTKCFREFPLSKYQTDSRTPDKKRSECRECKAALDRKTKYGIHDDLYQDIYMEQKCLCAICLIPLAKVVVCVDHDHATGKVRGLLCRSCNQALGLFRDHPEILRRASEYARPS